MIKFKSPLDIEHQNGTTHLGDEILSASNWELRWFFEGSIPQGLIEWREQQGFKGPKSQNDTYIYLPDGVDLGIKMSRGEFQVKFKAENREYKSGNGDQTGQMELWVKRVIELKSDNTSIFSGLKGDPIYVEKERYQKRYEVNLENQTIVPVDGRVDVGIMVGVSSIKGKGKDWWTIGIDGLSDNVIEQIDLIELGGKIVLDKHLDVELNIENSYSYPKWISLL